MPFWLSGTQEGFSPFRTKGRMGALLSCALYVVWFTRVMPAYAIQLGILLSDRVLRAEHTLKEMMVKRALA